ncbi:MAG: O-antigen ligase family protein [Patescibacteria group bacterium]|nr:O-antigen ligase family protein [Patescibacteria group bacterium]
MKNIFKNKYFSITFLILFIFETISFITHEISSIENFVFIITSLLISYFIIKNIEYAIYISFVELIVGSQGHLLDLNIAGFDISLRMMIFAISFIAGIIYLLKNKTKLFKSKSTTISFCIFIIMLLWGTILALIYKRPIQNIFLDLNGYLFILILPVFYNIIMNRIGLRKTFVILLTATIFFSLKTIIIFYIFSHHFAGFDLATLYKWLRDLRIFEITRVNDNFYRIFSQSQIYLLISFSITSVFIAYNKIKENKILFTAGILNLIAIIISFSRSYWVGLLVGGILFLFWLIAKKIEFKKIFIMYSKFAFMFIFSLLVIFALTKIPYTSTKLNNLLSERLTQGEAASNSRLELLPHMTDAIKKSPILGHGLSYEITYFSQDPRNKTDENSSGFITTYSFEWGWLSIWLKFGILGLIAYSYIILKILFDFVKLNLANKKMNEKYLLTLGLVIGLMTVCFTNIFSPYLDHPLGISLIILIISIQDKLKWQKSA